MPTVVGVRLRFAPKVLYFDPADTAPTEGDTVIVETERGTEIGIVALPPHDVESSQIPAPLKPVLRVADEEDLARDEEACEREREAMGAFRELVREHGLDMKPVAVEWLFGGDKAVFYFSAEERVDFRNLVRDLAGRFKVRVDMRQIGVRDEARMLGGLGHCGQQLCCVRFPGEFQPVSIRMAKEQDLPLNPLKISGLCGRLMCCLRYEYDAYKDFKSRAPKRGSIIETPAGAGKVVDLNTPREAVTLRLEDGKNFTVPLAKMDCGKGGACPCRVPAEVMNLPTPALLETEPETEKESAEDRKPRRRERQRPARKQGGQKAEQVKRGGQKAEAKQSKPGPSEAPQKKETSSGRRRRRRRRPSDEGGGEGK